MANVLPFDQVLEDSKQFSKRHLILGNGFSIACCPDIFHYGSLFERADFGDRQELTQVFKKLDTQDFEVAIRSLEGAAKLTPLYTSSDASAAARMADDAAALKIILLSTIAENHPNIPADVPDEKFRACRKFLSHFLSNGNTGQVYTLNYDLLLYWTLMHEDIPLDESDEPIELSANDGFGNEEDDPDTEYVVWQGETGAHNAKVHFLHGALHLFDAGNELQKFTWVRTSAPLIDQARAAIEADKFPLFVAEGSSHQKKTKIRHNAYLYQGFKQLTANAETGKHCFFIHGHSLARNDDHILKRLGRGKFQKLYVSLFGDPEANGNRNIVAQAQRIAQLRHRRHPLELSFYDAQSASVWGNS